MPISVNEFNEKGTAPVRVGFSGQKTKNILELLESEEAAFSISEVAAVAETDMNDTAAVRNLKNLMYGLRKKGKVEVRVVDGETYYALIASE